MSEPSSPPDESLAVPEKIPQEEQERVYTRFEPVVVISCFAHRTSWHIIEAENESRDMVDHIAKYEDEYEDDAGNFTRCRLTYAVGREYMEEKNPGKRGVKEPKG